MVHHRVWDLLSTVIIRLEGHWIWPRTQLFQNFVVSDVPVRVASSSCHCSPWDFFLIHVCTTLEPKNIDWDFMAFRDWDPPKRIGRTLLFVFCVPFIATASAGWSGKSSLFRAHHGHGGKQAAGPPRASRPASWNHECNQINFEHCYQRKCTYR